MTDEPNTPPGLSGSLGDHSAEHVIREIFSYAESRTASWMDLIEALRAEMKGGFVDVRADVKSVSREVIQAQADIRETQRLQGVTNGRLSDAEAAIAAIVKRHEAEDRETEIRRRLHESRDRKLKFAWNLIRFAANNDTVVKVVGATVLVALAADKVGWLP